MKLPSTLPGPSSKAKEEEVPDWSANSLKTKKPFNLEKAQTLLQIEKNKELRQGFRFQIEDKVIFETFAR